MVNKVILIGNVGKDAEVRYIDNGAAVATFSLATSETYTAKKGKKVKNTEWYNIFAWLGLAEFSGKDIQKGRQLYIEGQIRTRSYDDKEGNKKYITEILANTIQLLGRRDANDSSNIEINKPENNVVNQSSDIDSSDAADDLPF